MRGIGNSIGFISALVIFVIAYNTTGLTVPKIFSVLEMGAILKLTVLYVVLGIGVYYESTIVFNRFAGIFSLEEAAMIKLDASIKSSKITSS